MPFCASLLDGDEFSAELIGKDNDTDIMKSAQN
jgi:hypothetical protein